MNRRLITSSVILAIIVMTLVSMAAVPSIKVVKGAGVPVVADLEKMDKVDGLALYKNSKGVVTGPFAIKGVKLSEVVKLAGGMTDAEKLIVSSSDGYVTELSFAQANGEVAVTKADGSPVEGKPVVTPVLITWSEPAMEKDLPRLAFISETGLITESKYWARNVVEIKIAPAK
jgi:hypothetical protein